MWWFGAQERELPKLEKVAPERPGVTNEAEPPKVVESQGRVCVKSDKIESGHNKHGVQEVTREGKLKVVEAESTQGGVENVDVKADSPQGGVEHMDVGERSQENADGTKAPCRKCVCCGKPENPMYRCSACHSGLYCSRECQKKVWKEHKGLCTIISQLEVHLEEVTARNEEIEREQQLEDKIYMSSRSNFSPKQEMKIVQLVGKQCLVKCKLNRTNIESLWDTGAQVAMVGQTWLRKHFPNIEIQDISKLLEDELGESGLVLKAANNVEIGYVGYVDLVFQMGDSSQPPLLVPFIVSEEDLTRPIIGNNVIEMWVNGEGEPDVKQNLTEVLENSLEEVSRKNVEGLVNLIQNKKEDGDIYGNVVVGRKDV